MQTATPLRLLVIDDDEIDRERVRRYLAQAPVAIVTQEADSGEAALDLARHTPYDCVVLDNQLGDTNGSELLQRLRKDGCTDCPIIMVTGAGSEELVVRALHDGAADYLSKISLTQDRLIKAVLSSVETHKLRSELDEMHRQLEQRVEQQAAAIRRSERDLRDILDHATSLIGYWDVQERVRFGNRLHETWFGIPLDKLPGLSVREAIGETLYAIHAQPLRLALSGQAQVFEHTWTRRDTGALCHLHADYRPDLDAQGHVLGCYVTITDVTASKQAHDVLIQARQTAEEAARVTQAFLANMSHEIRTPMNAILGLSRLALEEPLPPVAKGHVERVYNSAQALMGLLDDVLDYAKADAGQMRIEQIDIDLEELLQRTVDLFSGRIQQKGLRFDVVLTPDVPAHIMGDALRLAQILNNLVGNAVKFTEQGRITLSLSRQDGTLRFAVRDTGIGIPTDKRNALFAAFAQGDDSISRRYGGTGLGLSICKRLVDLMDGRIGIISDPGRGSEFWFTLPLNGATEAPPPVPRGQVLLWAEDPVDARHIGLHLQRSGWVPRPVTRVDDLCSQLSHRPGPGHDWAAVILVWSQVSDHVDAILARLRTDLSASHAHGPGLIGIVPNHLQQALAQAAAHHPHDVLLSTPVLPQTLDKALRLMGPAHASTPGADRAQQLAARSAALRGLHVLLVEDNELNQMVAQAFLQQMGLQIETLSDGAQAVQHLENAPAGRYAAVLMDMHMPGMDGLEAARRIRQMARHQQLPIIAMTAAVLPADQARCREAGMVDMVTKPLVPEALADTLLKWVGTTH